MPGSIVKCRTSALASFDRSAGPAIPISSVARARAVWHNARCRLILTQEMSRSSQVPQHLYSSTTVTAVHSVGR